MPASPTSTPGPPPSARPPPRWRSPRQARLAAKGPVRQIPQHPRVPADVARRWRRQDRRRPQPAHPRPRCAPRRGPGAAVIDYVTGLGERAELIRMRAVEASQVNMLKVQAGPRARSPWAADVRRSGRGREAELHRRLMRPSSASHGPPSTAICPATDEGFPTRVPRRCRAATGAPGRHRSVEKRSFRNAPPGRGAARRS
jgi:hypothetical protein